MNDTGSGFTIRLGRTSRKQFSYQDVERMNMKDYIFPYGSGTVTLSLEETRVLGVLKGHDTPPLDDIGKGLYESLDAPVQSCSLRKWTSSGDKVALIISDMSRFWMRQDLVIPHLIHYLNEECGIPDEDITILVANGTHVGGDEKELRTLVTSEIYDRIRVINHDCLAEDLVTIGVTSRGTTVRINKIAAMADRVIALGACTHHVMAGYGGGRKSILPGISAMDTICHNHAFALDPEVFRSNPLIGNSVTKGNPLNEDMCEAAALVPMLFTINLVMNADMKLCKIFSGDCQASWEAGCRAIDDIYRVNVKEKADVVIAFRVDVRAAETAELFIDVLILDGKAVFGDVAGHHHRVQRNRRIVQILAHRVKGRHALQQIVRHLRVGDRREVKLHLVRVRRRDGRVRRRGLIRRDGVHHGNQQRKELVTEPSDKGLEYHARSSF